MSDRQGFVNRLWTSLKAQIADEVPRDMQFCEFECVLMRCTLETTGSCEIRPKGELISIRPATIALPDWSPDPAGDAAAGPLRVH